LFADEDLHLLWKICPFKLFDGIAVETEQHGAIGRVIDNETRRAPEEIDLASLPEKQRPC